MKGKLFKQIFWTSMAFCVLCFVMIVGGSYHYESTQYRDRLWEETAYVAAGVEAAGATFLERAADTVEEHLTWIAADGTVLYDSLPNAAAGDPLQQEEVAAALATGRGESARYADTLGMTMTYYAQRLSDGSVVRLAAEPYTFFTLLMSLFAPLLVALVLVLTLSLLLARQVANSLVSPINEIDLSFPDERDVYPELQPLVRRINAQNRQIRHQIDELKTEHEKQDTLRREFTANVSHELKTPLTSISGYAELLREGAVRPEDVGRFSGKIYDEAQRLITLVGDIIKLSRLDSRVELPERTTVDLWEICEATLSQLEHAARKKAVTMQLTGERAYVFGAEYILSEMVYNLCDNAIKYNRENGAVTIALQNTPDGVRLTVTDTGIGIPAEEQERVFERFYRVDKSHSKDVGGTGLGLSIVKHGALYHQAEITMESTVDVGTAVTLRFPPLR